MLEEWVEPNLLYDIEVSGPVMYVDYTQVPAVLVSPTVTYSNVGALGNESNGQAIVSSTCAACHGADGTTLDLGGRTLGLFIREKPNEGWFKAKFGEPGAMVPGLVTATADLQDLYAALANSTNFPSRAVGSLLGAKAPLGDNTPGGVLCCRQPADGGGGGLRTAVSREVDGVALVLALFLV